MSSSEQQRDGDEALRKYPQQQQSRNVHESRGRGRGRGREVGPIGHIPHKRRDLVGRCAGRGRDSAGRQLYQPGRYGPSPYINGNSFSRQQPQQQQQQYSNERDFGEASPHHHGGRGGGQGRGRGRRHDSGQGTRDYRSRQSDDYNQGGRGRGKCHSVDGKEAKVDHSRGQCEKDWPSLPPPSTTALRAPAQEPGQTDKNSPVPSTTTNSSSNMTTTATTLLQQQQSVTPKRDSELPAKPKAKKHKPTLKNMSLADVFPESNASRSTPKSTPALHAASVKKAANNKQSVMPLTESVPPSRDLTGDEHALLRLMQQGKMNVTSKGRQRIRPRKKKFTSLKKRVLQERLQQWRALHPPAEATVSNGGELAQGTALCLFNFVTLDEVADDDEYDEFVSDLEDLATRVGKVKYVNIPREPVEWAIGRHPCFIEFHDHNDAAAAMACWSGMVVGGDKLDTISKAGSPESEEAWRAFCLDASWTTFENEVNAVAIEGPIEVILTNVLTPEDLEDEDSLQESLTDIRAIVERHGPVSGIRVEQEPNMRVVVQYHADMLAVRKAIKELNETVICGSTVHAELLSDSDSNAVLILNALTEDDLNDEECLQESLNDIRELAGRFGAVLDVSVSPIHGDGVLRIIFESSVGKEAAARGFEGMSIGGIAVSVLSDCGAKEVSVGAVDTRDVGPLYSGDKQVPDRFAECKRVPKIANKGVPRHYATMAPDPAVKEMLSEMVGELMRLQKRAIEENNAKARRRLVMGLREVARGIRSHKVKMVLMANNLDEYGAIDEKLQEIIDLSRTEGVPIFFEFNKRGLGKAIGKSIKVAVVGVQNAEGAHHLFKKLAARGQV